MLNNLNNLLNTLPQQGIVEWIGLREKKREPINVVDSVEVTVEKGLLGDRYSGKLAKRQVTLIQAEHLTAIASMLNIPECPPERLRRNIVIRGINLLALKNKQFQIGSAILEYTGLCHPCSRMEETFGPGGYNAVRGHGGITAQVVSDGVIQLDDKLTMINKTEV